VPINNGSANFGAQLSLLYGGGTTPSPTGFSANPDGSLNFVSNQVLAGKHVGDGSRLTNLPNTFTAGGDLTGGTTLQIVSKLQGVPLAITGTGTTLAPGSVLSYNGGSWIPAPGFSLGGDLSGTATAQTLSKLQGMPLILTGTSASPGVPGPAATVQIGIVATGSPGLRASVTNSGGPNAAILNFSIPQGVSGSGGGFNGIQDFTQSGSFTVPAGVTHILVELWGAGGGFGGYDYQPTGCFPPPCLDVHAFSNNGTPGGGGSYTKAVVAVTPVATYSIVIGAGGTGGPGTTMQRSPPGGLGGNTSVRDASGNVLATAIGGGSPSGGVGTPGTVATTLINGTAVSTSRASLTITAH
jgi:hypothetical protein